MTLKNDLKDYRDRWGEVDAVIKEERRTASLELRWQQLNAAFAMGISLGLQREESSEAGVFDRWAKLKGKVTNQSPKA